MAGLKFDTLPDVGSPQAYYQQPKTKKKDFLTDQISTVGGILGGIAGLPLGILGAGGGSAAGSGLGEVIENILIGEDPTKNVGQEAVLGGVFGAGPIRLGKALIGGGRTTTETAARGTLTQNATEPLKTSTQGKLQDLGNQALTSQYGTISKPVARATNPSQTIGQLADYGVTNPQDVERISNAITGADGIINRAVIQSVSGARGVNTGGMRRIAKDAIEINGLVEKDAASVRQVVEAQFKKLEGGPAGSIRPNANPNDVFEVMKALEKRASNLRGRGSNNRLTTPEREDQARVLLQVRDELEDRLFQASGADQNVSKVLTPRLREQLMALQPNNPRWQAFVDERIMPAQGVRELRSATAPFVRANQIIDEGDMNSMTFGGRGGNLFSALSSGQGAAGTIGNVVSGLVQPIAARYGGQALREAGNKVPRQGATRPMRPLGVAARVGVGAPVASSLVDVLQGDASFSEPPATLESALLQTQSPTGLQQQTPYTQENLLYDIQRDPKNADEYIKQYQALQEIFSPQQAKLNATQQETANRARNALLDLQVLEQAIDSGDLLKTAIPFSDNAFVGNALGTTDIQSALFNIGDVILRARTGAQAPESEVRAFVRGFLPRGGESRESQLYKLQRAARELAGMASPSATQQPSDLAAAIMATR